MAWLSSVMLIGAIVIGIVVGMAATQPIEKMIEAEAAA